jgi:hypothetical protein
VAPPVKQGDVVTPRHELVHKKRTNKARPAQNENPAHEGHELTARNGARRARMQRSG